MPMSQDFTKYQQNEPATPKTHAEDVIISPDTRRAIRLPPGQSRTRKWPVLHFSRVPIIPLEEWQLTIGGLVKNPLSFSWQEFQELPRVKVFSDFHCVTRWSRLGNLWEGVSIQELLQRADPLPQAKYAIAGGYDDGWTTNMPLSEFARSDALIADKHDGEPIIPDHGGPARLVVPQLYAWKSAKWVCSIELTDRDRPGLWERNGYHNNGNPWKEQRHSW